MDITKIVVIVLILISFGFLVYVELNSRRNTRAMKELASEPAPTPADEVRQKRA